MVGQWVDVIAPQYRISLFLWKYWELSGAPERNNLEPFDGDQLLSELENWADILKAAPEVIHRLAVLAETQDEDTEDAPIVGPDPPEPGL